MYLPDHFHEDDSEHLAAFLGEAPFGMLVSVTDGAPFASHLPFLLQRGDSPHGRLLGHMARANPQWRHFAAGGEALVVFQGPHAYVSPSWYASPGVPTWNYLAVHARGPIRLIEDADALGALIERQTRVQESRFTPAWQPNLSGERRTRLLGMIVGFELEITELQCKFKLSQNRPLEDRQQVAAQLDASDDPMALAVSRLMRGEERPD
jgi:transcriptional regulator